jgi:hypothetical protein
VCVCVCVCVSVCVRVCVSVWLSVWRPSQCFLLIHAAQKSVVAHIVASLLYVF